MMERGFSQSRIEDTITQSVGSMAPFTAGNRMAVRQSNLRFTAAITNIERW